MPSGNDNHTISLDLINTPPQVLVLFPQVASVSLSSSPDITPTLGKLMVSPPPPPATPLLGKLPAELIYLSNEADPHSL